MTFADADKQQIHLFEFHSIVRAYRRCHPLSAHFTCLNNNKTEDKIRFCNLQTIRVVFRRWHLTFEKMKNKWIVDIFLYALMSVHYIRRLSAAATVIMVFFLLMPSKFSARTLRGVHMIKVRTVSIAGIGTVVKQFIIIIMFQMAQ